MHFSLPSYQLQANQIAYASKDALAHLEVYEALKDMPDLNRRLERKDVKVGDKIDIVPRSGMFRNVSLMATRAATGYVLDLSVVNSPAGISPRSRVRGKKYVAVEIETIHSPSFYLPDYKVSSTNKAATLQEIGKSIVIVPLTMLRDHTDSRSTQPPPRDETSNAVSAPAAKPPTISAIATDSTANGSKVVDDDFFEPVSIEDLTTADIEMIRAANESSSAVEKGKIHLRHRNLNDPPLGPITDKYSSVLGDPFHAISRPKVPTHHEHKKGYKVALQNAFYIWNETKMKELEALMRKDGMSEEQLESQRYYNSDLYRGCVERYVFLMQFYAHCI